MLPMPAKLAYYAGTMEFCSRAHIPVRRLAAAIVRCGPLFALFVNKTPIRPIPAYDRRTEKHRPHRATRVPATDRGALHFGTLWAGRRAGPLFPALGYWLIVLAAITWVCAAAASAENTSLVTTLAFLSAGSTLSAIALLAGLEGLLVLSGYLFIICAVAAWYTASALMLNEVFGREVWALGRSTQAKQMPQITAGIGEPGVIRGQA